MSSGRDLEPSSASKAAALAPAARHRLGEPRPPERGLRPAHLGRGGGVRAGDGRRVGGTGMR